MSERCGAALTVPYAPPINPPPPPPQTQPQSSCYKRLRPASLPSDPGADFDRSTDRAADPAHSASHASANRDFLPALQIPAGHRVRAEFSGPLFCSRRDRSSRPTARRRARERNVDRRVGRMRHQAPISTPGGYFGFRRRREAWSSASSRRGEARVCATRLRRQRGRRAALSRLPGPDRYASRCGSTCQAQAGC